MARSEMEQRSVPIPESVQVELSKCILKVTGAKGTLSKDFSQMPLHLSTDGKNVLISASWPRKREISLVGTAAAHVRNMMKGVTIGHMYKMKIVYAHFPATVKVREKEGKIIVDNFTGERTSRAAKIVGDTKVTLSGDEVIIEGVDLESVSQTAANLQATTRIKEKDQRVFLDGIYVYEKS